MKATFPPSVIALGKFDGIHKGHQELIKKVIENKDDSLVSAVFTFDKTILNFTEEGLLPLLNEDERIVIFNELGIEYIACYSFDDSLKNLSRESFVEEILIKRLNAKKVVIGEDFRFGKGREGDVSWLNSVKDSYNLELIVVPDLADDDGRISSSRIRDCLIKADIKAANKMLGRPYSISGRIIHGRELGRTIGIPTTNVKMPKEQFVPALGVYITKSTIDAKEYYGISNLGFKPTVNGKHLLCETNLFNFYDDVYDRDMKVEFLEYIRPEKKFSSVMELQEEMKRNILYAKSYVREHFNK
ncbi:MAG: bifunctional riboflavin kinase/FAD synthetase [Lachnospiraceae bacterium]|nr:bifunctional riboflavin kinase/FAD synthetase [Lachnospiraceae bacterium]